MRRREFIALVGGASAWPLAARAQQTRKLPTVGFMGAGTSLIYSEWVNAFLERLREHGWTEGRTVAIEYRWAEGSYEHAADIAAEFVRMKVGVIVTASTPNTLATKKATSEIPIIFASAGDPVGGGLVASLARPGGNVTGLSIQAAETTGKRIELLREALHALSRLVDSLSRPGGNATGFVLFDYSLSTKRLELLKQIVPGVTRAAVLRDPAITSGIGQWGAISSAAPSLGIEVSPVNVRDAPEIERGVAAFARSDNGGLIVTGSPLSLVHRDLIITLAARHKLPTVYFLRPFVTDGGLISYGPDLADQFRRAASYIDRILKGEKPADLPVQAPSKYELVINLKTAKELGLTIPPSVLARADEVIE